MTQTPPEGHDGPYEAPIRTASRTVPPEWIDYNGHMNVAYYTMAADQALDRMLEDHLGVGEKHARDARQGPYALQSQMHYLGELLEGASFHARLTLLDHDAKRVHIFLELIADADGSVAATCETLLMNVDLEARRSVPYPDWAQARMARMKADHADVPRSDLIGAVIGIRRRS
ncbi:MAG: thioesterase family protein [Pseudomonadota bacterium]